MSPKDQGVQNNRDEFENSVNLKVLEMRLSYINSEKIRLNSDTFFLAKSYIAVLLISYSWMAVSTDLVGSVSSNLIFLIYFIALFGGAVSLIMVLNVISWWDLRVEEVDVINSGTTMTRSLPKLRSAWRWRETWVVGGILLCSVAQFFLSRQIGAIFISK